MLAFSRSRIAATLGFSLGSSLTRLVTMQLRSGRHALMLVRPVGTAPANYGRELSTLAPVLIVGIVIILNASLRYDVAMTASASFRIVLAVVLLAEWRILRMGIA